ncbi:MAG: xanthine dehydrogenase accessory protein XdhC [Ruegeria sp.]
MSFDIDELAQAVAQHGRVVRVVIGAIKGSSPRDVGAAMLVWESGQTGTIGGGALEYHAAEAARALSADRISRHALGPELGQCCGGAVTLVSEVYDAERVAALGDDIIARPVGSSSDRPLAVTRLFSDARSQGRTVPPVLINDWMVDPVFRAPRALWIWGAGHVGRALVTTLAPLPDFKITWVDTAPARFPDAVPAGVIPLPAADPVAVLRHAPVDAEHLVLTYSHELDFALCHALLTHGFTFAGLIGSATKWARFRKRLRALGHGEARIAQITCPIGDPSLGKHPAAIALGVGAALLAKTRDRAATVTEIRA